MSKQKRIRRASVFYYWRGKPVEPLKHEETTKINAHFNAQEIPNNAQSGVHYLPLNVCNILEQLLLNIFFTPKHLSLFACGKPLGNFVNNSDEGYRMLV